MLHHDQEQNPDGVEGLRRSAPELATLFDALRGEFDAKISSLKAWGVAMCFLGGAVGGLTASVAEVVKPGVTQSVVRATLMFFV